MNKRLSAILMAGLVSVMPIASSVPVSAQSLSGEVHTVGYRGGLGFGGGHPFNHGNFASGVFGFTLGTIIGGALAGPRYGGPYYDVDPGYRGGYYGRGYYGRGLYDRGYYGRGLYNRGYYGRGLYDRGYYGRGLYNRGYYGRGYYRQPSYSVQNSDFHVQRCLDRYRSYDPGSDTFMGYDGRRHYCNL